MKELAISHTAIYANERIDKFLNSDSKLSPQGSSVQNASSLS